MVSGWGQLVLRYSVGNSHMVFLLLSSPTSGCKTWLSLYIWALLRCTGTLKHPPTGFLLDCRLGRRILQGRNVVKGCQKSDFHPWKAFLCNLRLASMQTWYSKLSTHFGLKYPSHAFQNRQWTCCFKAQTIQKLSLQSLENVDDSSPFFTQQYCYWFEIKSM